MSDHAERLADIATAFERTEVSTPHAYWVRLSRQAEALSNALPTGELQNESRHYAIQAAFRAHDGKRAWEMSVGWGLAKAEAT